MSESFIIVSVNRGRKVLRTSVGIGSSKHVEAFVEEIEKVISDIVTITCGPAGLEVTRELFVLSLHCCLLLEWTRLPHSYFLLGGILCQKRNLGLFLYGLYMRNNILILCC